MADGAFCASEGSSVRVTELANWRNLGSLLGGGTWAISPEEQKPCCELEFHAGGDSVVECWPSMSGGL